MKGNACIPFEAGARELGIELGLSEEALRVAGELGEHERLARHRLCLRRKSIREKVNTNSAAPGLATRAASSIARRNCAAERARFQMPWAITKIDAAVAQRDALHGREQSMKPAVEMILAGAVGGGNQHRPREVGTDDVPAKTREREGVASGAASDIERAPGVQALQLLRRKRHQHRVRRRLRKSRDGAGCIHGEPASGSTFET